MKNMKREPEKGKLFEEFIERYVNLEQMAEDFKALKPYQRLVLLEKFASYIWPKMKSIEMDISREEMSPEMVSLIRHLGGKTTEG